MNLLCFHRRIATTTTTRTLSALSSSTPLYAVAESSSSPSVPIVTLFTKVNCHLCDVVKAVMKKSSKEHRLVQVNIGLPERAGWFDKYKYDIPVLHINGQYVAKHRITLDEFDGLLDEASREPEGPRRRPGEPNPNIIGGKIPTESDPFNEEDL